ncbi:MAG: hypothetical protein ABEJ67_02755 [Halanaeroarchaeum sp.]
MSRSTGTAASDAGDDLDHRIERYPEGAACTIFPRGASDEELVTTWITAEADSFVALDDVR